MISTDSVFTYYDSVFSLTEPGNNVNNRYLFNKSHNYHPIALTNAPSSVIIAQV